MNRPGANAPRPRAGSRRTVYRESASASREQELHELQIVRRVDVVGLARSSSRADGSRGHRRDPARSTPARTASTAGPLRAKRRGLSCRRVTGGPAAHGLQALAVEPHHRHRRVLVRHLDDAARPSRRRCRTSRVDRRIDVSARRSGDVGCSSTHRDQASVTARARRRACCSTGSIGASSPDQAGGPPERHVESESGRDGRDRVVVGAHHGARQPRGRVRRRRCRPAADGRRAA